MASGVRAVKGAVQAIGAVHAVDAAKDSDASAAPTSAKEVDFGIWDVDEIQLCKMGSYGPQGEYVSCGGFLIR